MTNLTKKYIFKCKLAGKPIEFDTEELQDKKVLKLLLNTGVWKTDPPFTDNFWKEYSFTILHPIRIINTNMDGSYTPHLLENGDHHLVCM